MERLRSITTAYLVLISWCLNTVAGGDGHLSFCYNGAVTLGEDCEGGLLFNRPLNLKAVSTSGGNSFCVKSSICDEAWQCSSHQQSITAQLIKLDKSSNLSWADVEEPVSPITTFIPACHPHKFWKRNPRSKRQAEGGGAVNGLVPSEKTSVEALQREVDDQTKRLFYYLTGINQDQVNSHLRVVKLFKMSTQLASIVCDPQYLSPAFLGEVEKAFLFLLKEQGFDDAVDMDVESYQELKAALEHCASTVTPVKFLGEACPGRKKVEVVYRVNEKTGRVQGLPYQRSEKTFKWGEYDVVLDAAWGIVNVVHGGCFPSFSAKLNLHHKFQVALEKLFSAALYLRWEHPTRLGDEGFYDAIFLTNINDTMEVMDACTRFLHLLTPFRVELGRPIQETIYRRRRKREVEDELATTLREMSLDEIERTFSSESNAVEVDKERALEVENRGTCIGLSEDEHEARINEMRRHHCF